MSKAILVLNIRFKKEDKHFSVHTSKSYGNMFEIIGSNKFEDENVVIWQTGTLEYSDEELIEIYKKEGTLNYQINPDMKINGQ